MDEGWNVLDILDLEISRETYKNKICYRKPQITSP